MGLNLFYSVHSDKHWLVYIPVLNKGCKVLPERHNTGVNYIFRTLNGKGRVAIFASDP